MDWSASNQGPLAALRTVARAARSAAEETCDLCSAPLTPGHRHLQEVAHRQINCACDPCTLRFENVIGERFELIPRDARLLTGFRVTDAQWDELAIPINLAFIFFSTPKEKMTALYPGPAGAIESLLPIPKWQTLATANPVLTTLEPDTEAVLINRVGTAREYFTAPIELCFELAGLFRNSSS